MNPAEWEGLYYIAIGTYSLLCIFCFWAGCRSVRRNCDQRVREVEAQYRAINDNRERSVRALLAKYEETRC